MEGRFVPAAPAEARPIDTRGGDDRGGSSTLAMDDPRALQILTTEHWSLLTARSLASLVSRVFYTRMILKHFTPPGYANQDNRNTDRLRSTGADGPWGRCRYR